MTKQPKPFEVLTPEVNGRWLDLGDGLAAPEVTRVPAIYGDDVLVTMFVRTVREIEDHEDPGWFDSELRLVVDEVKIRRVGGIPPELFRELPFRELAHEATGRTPRLVRHEASSSRVVVDPAELSTDERDRFAALVDRKVQRSRRRQMTDDFLGQVADVYRAALDGGRPTAAVREHFHTSEPTAARWVQKARAAGFLGPAEPGKAGA